MRKSFLALLFIPLLAAAAEPPPYDMAATPEATSIRQHALNHCRAAPPPREEPPKPVRE